MAEEHEKLQNALNQLQSQLDAVRQLDPAVAERLAATLAEAKVALSGKPTPPAAQRSIVERLSDAVLQYEASHPELAGNLGSIIDALGRMGI